MVLTRKGVVCAKYQLINLESTSGVMACFTTCFNRKTPPPTKHGITLEEGTLGTKYGNYTFHISIIAANS